MRGRSKQRDDEAWEGLAWYAQRRPVFTGGNEVHLLRGGQQFFPALRDQIEHAQHSVWLAFYMVSPHGQASTILQALKQAARRGVDVHLLVDGAGSHDAPQNLWEQLRGAGVKVVIHRPFHRFWGVLQSSEWRRMHFKLCAIDDNTAFVGGINLIDDRLDLHHGWTDEPRLDYAVQLKGSVCTPVLHAIKAIWTRSHLGRDWREEIWPWMQDKHRIRRMRGLWQQARMRLTPEEQVPFIKAASNPHPVRCAFVMRDNLRQRRTIERAAIQAIHQARHEIDIVTPYFYPARQLRLALKQAAERGVRVRLLLQGKVDIPIAGVAARVLYVGLLRSGIDIYEYQAAFLHAKVMRVDQDWATVGSSNLDPLSLVLNMEANVIIRDRNFVGHLIHNLEKDFSHSIAIPREQHQPTRWGKLGHWLFSLGAKLYLRLSGNSGRY